jgi:hypothetical protein
MSQYVNSSTLRAADDAAFFGIAVYTLIRTEDSFVGRHVGVVEDADKAKAWVDGDDSIKRVRIYPDG